MLYYSTKILTKSAAFKCRILRKLSGLNLWDKDISSNIKHKVENYWRDKLPQEHFNPRSNDKQKYYVLSMFPYPSGSLHMGHVRVYTISDVIARFQRMNGKNVIHPIGWDSFGLPAENAAIERQIPPEEWTMDNISYMKKQIQELGCSFEWNREFTTCDPKYYKWTQELFLKLYDAGLVYQKEATVNWDPLDQTVLADEQVDENNRSWRSGAIVEKKLLRQWFVKTTQFAKDLLHNLDDPVLEDWRDIIKLQKHWIGECNGVNFEFKIQNSSDYVKLWTDMPQYIENVKFVCISDSHVLAKQENISGSGTFKLNSELVNPLTNEIVPVYCTDEIEFLPSTDSYIGIPGSSEPSTNFAEKQSIPYRPLPQFNSTDELNLKQQQVCEIAKKLNVGGYWSSPTLRDWLISRQRFWGTPIPIIHCNQCGAIPVRREQLPVTLPKSTELTQKGGLTQLTKNKEWLHALCPNCGGNARRETDTMDTFVDSSWYFLRYLDPNNGSEMFDKEEAMKCMPVDLYIGGKEHAVLHLYYARFINHFLYSLGLVPEKEPFKRLLVQGMVMGRSFRVKGSGKYLPESQVNIIDLKKNKAVDKDTGEDVVIAWEKMSKSRHNGVNPEDMFREYGTDTTRLLILADVSPTSHRNWNSNTFPGVLNWQKRLWLTIRDFLKHRNNLPPMIPDDAFTKHDEYMFDSRNYYIKGVTFNYLISQQISVAVSKLQGLTNSLRKVPPAVIAHSTQFERALAAQIILMAPMAPHFASELWSGFTSAPNRLNQEEVFWDKSVLEQTWPETDWDYQLELVCQVNGVENSAVKYTRKDLESLTKDEATAVALSQPEVRQTLLRRNVQDVTFKVHQGCQGIVNILTDQPPPREKKQKDDVIVENL